MNELSPDPSLWPTALLEDWGVFGREAPVDLPALALELSLPEDITGHLASVYGPLTERLARRLPTLEQPMVLGINGAQGTGKSTAAEVIAHMLELRGFSVCRLSIDDLYLTREERAELAGEVHPLLATRGVPGTHDVKLGLQLLSDLAEAGSATQLSIPRFDKARDDRRPPEQWEPWQGRPHLVVFEGWCVGARAQPDTALTEPMNDLERTEDPDGRWRRYVNEQLKGYEALFSQMDHLLMLKAPSFEQVYQWRSEQEEALARKMKAKGEDTSGLMASAQLRRFIDHYERLTRWILAEMPERADLVLSLNPAHRVERISVLRGTKL
ncbi:phosphoribulokinase [Marinimicrobium agarilyticum]|uniref:phosphoribulokinase n=1 Tax=Marinimicrobium agarilyticum TaxID=306546 RepID=UPI000415347A|nr:phosphoribulokinase [Marinimicrobium agarilyticum]